jgi:hypothetical protein
VPQYTINISLLFQARGVLKKELLEYLSVRRTIRRCGHSNQHGDGRGRVPHAVLMAIVLCAAILITVPAMAQRSLPTPGSTWGEIHFPGSALPEDSDNFILEGAVEQGVDFFPITKDTILNFFGSLDYSVDTEGFDWYRRLELGVGFKLRHYLSDTTIISVGAKYEVEKYFVDERTANGFQLFSNWFSSWQLRNSDHHSGEPVRPLGFPGITWGEIRYPGTQLPLDEDNLIFDGYVEQGVDWAHWGRWGTFNFYANLDFITDTEDLPWNNSIAYGAGVKLKKLVGSNVLLQFGIEAVHERRWVSDQDNDVIFVYLNWSGWWDPRAIRLDLPE